MRVGCNKKSFKELVVRVQKRIKFEGAKYSKWRKVQSITEQREMEYFQM